MTKTLPRLDRITATFAILDVKNGRAELAEHFKDRAHIRPCPTELRVPVTIHGAIDGIWSGDDGISMEFSVDVQRLEFPQSRKCEPATVTEVFDALRRSRFPMDQAAFNILEDQRVRLEMANDALRRITVEVDGAKIRELAANTLRNTEDPK